MVVLMKALGVAGNVVQFIDFGSKLFSLSLEIYEKEEKEYYLHV